MSRPGISSWCRAGVVALAMAVVPASILGRFDRSRAALIPARSPSPPGFAFLSGRLAPKAAGDPCVVDLTTGELGGSPVAGQPRLDLASASPCVDRRGRRQVVGRQAVRSGELMELALARYELPGGKLLDRIPLDAPPISRPCWDASGLARIVYVGSDGELRRVDYEGGGSRAPAVVAWKAGRAGRDSVRYAPTEVCWCGGAGSGPYLIATMASTEADPRIRSRLWWLRLDPTCRAVDEAGPLIGPGDAGWYGESDPAVSPGCGRPPILAFMAVGARGGRKDLFTAALRFDPATGHPSVRPDDLRPVVRDCGDCPPAFSPDGRHLLYLVGSAGPRRFARHEVAP